MLKQLESIASLEGVTVNVEAENDGGEKAKEIFCKASPALVVGMEAAGTMIQNPIVKAILGLNVLIIKALQKRICYEATTEATTEG